MPLDVASGCVKPFSNSFLNNLLSVSMQTAGMQLFIPLQSNWQLPSFPGYILTKKFLNSGENPGENSRDQKSNRQFYTPNFAFTFGFDWRTFHWVVDIIFFTFFAAYSTHRILHILWVFSKIGSIWSCAWCILWPIMIRFIWLATTFYTRRNWSLPLK